MATISSPNSLRLSCRCDNNPNHLNLSEEIRRDAQALKAFNNAHHLFEQVNQTYLSHLQLNMPTGIYERNPNGQLRLTKYEAEILGSWRFSHLTTALDFNKLSNRVAFHPFKASVRRSADYNSTFCLTRTELQKSSPRSIKARKRLTLPAIPSM